MNLANVMDEMGAALDTIGGLNIFPFSAARVTPPAAIVGWPDPLTYDATMRRGGDRLTMPVYVVVGKVEARSARDRLAVYLDRTDAASVKTALDGGTYTACDSVRVMDARVDGVTIAGVEYLGAIFQVDVMGTGGA